MIDDPCYQLVILDELNPVLHYGYLGETRVLEALSQRRADLHIVVTGRNAPAELVNLADLVSDIRAIKHPLSRSGHQGATGD